MKCPKQSGSQFYKYKGFHSVILMALVDADYKFTWVEVGRNGSASDAQVSLTDDDKDMPYFIIADDAFTLRRWPMKPFSMRNMTRTQRIFTYIMSRAQRIVGNAFGILAHRFRCLLTTLQQESKTVTSIVLT